MTYQAAQEVGILWRPKGTVSDSQADGKVFDKLSRELR
jgi:hypothetical protein